MTVLYLFKDRFIISFSKKSKIFICTSLVFVLYVIFINTIWSLILNGNLEVFTASAFYIYNFVVSLMVLMLYYEYQDVFYKYMYKSILISIFMQLVIYLASGGFDGTRSLGFFNNPNQLGYHNLLMLAFLIMISQRKKLKTGLYLTSVLSTLILCFSSLSKAAIIAYAGMLFYYSFIKMMAKTFDKKAFIYMLIATLIISAAYYFNREVIASNQLYISVMNRVSTIGMDRDDNLAGRGYYRLIHYPQYLIFGAGEGEYLRFKYYIEFHSTLGNILMSYGIIGLFLYLASIIFAIKNNGWKDTYIIFFIFLYGLTHNGIRNTLLWILVASISGEDISTNAVKYNSLGKEGLLNGGFD
ncbi:hypothetical protein SDC9_132845 [bioreactor metagenome]|uniref:O-antigen ligase n=1 Tax=bioreactor metagenome TaxID=1076179 RepID=A0A645D8X4_9ZZZZ